MTRKELLTILNTKKSSKEIVLSGVMEFAEFNNSQNIKQIPQLVEQQPQLLNYLFQESLPYLLSKYQIVSLEDSFGRIINYY